MKELHCQFEYHVSYILKRSLKTRLGPKKVDYIEGVLNYYKYAL